MTKSSSTNYPLAFYYDVLFIIINVYFLSIYVVYLKYLKSFGDFSSGVHLFPFRTEKLSPLAPMILQYHVGK